jgi:hypothetical protein
MSEAPRLAGGCLCGAVRFTAAPATHDYGICHCNMCRRWTAGPFMAIDCDGTLAFDADADVGIYESSHWAERGFCKKCGTPLFYRLRGKDAYHVSVEAFDETGDFKLVSEIFIDEKPAHYSLANDTKKMTGAQVMALFAPQSAPQGGDNA